jgi:hypothetical protein
MKGRDYKPKEAPTTTNHRLGKVALIIATGLTTQTDLKDWRQIGTKRSDSKSVLLVAVGIRSRFTLLRFMVAELDRNGQDIYLLATWS